MERNHFIKILAGISVFFIFFFIPIAIFKKIEMNIIDMEVKSNLNNLNGWAKIYKINHGSFEGMENSYEISKIVKTLNYMGKECELILNNNVFCAKAKIFDLKLKNWCVDNNDYSGPKINNCDYGKKIQCQ